MPGGDGTDGDLILKDGDGQNRIHLSAGSANVVIGGDNADGDLVLFPSTAVHDISDFSQATIHLDGEAGSIIAGGGGDGTDGDLILKDGDGQNRIHLSAGSANVVIGGDNADGDLVLFPSTAVHDISDFSQATIHLDGEAGDIILQNADAAEDFDVADSGLIEPGTVVVIDEQSKLRQCTQAYDKCVAGVISGAGDLRPGMILGRDRSRKTGCQWR